MISTSFVSPTLMSSNALTVIVQVAVNPFSLVAVMTAEPSVKSSAMPLLSTLTMLGALLSQLTLSSEAPSGVNVTVSSTVFFV